MSQTDAHTIPWWRKTTIYHIYPRSFYDSNGDGIGDIAGIIEKLDYIRDLGFETVWISPFFQSPQKDFGYDISDYYRIDPVYGDIATVERLIEEVHQRKMYILFDMVLNHTSDQHPWFLQSRKSRDNPYSDWYIWRNGNGKKPPNNWRALTGRRGWHYVPERSQWFYASFLPFQPDLNYRNPEVKSAMLDVLKFWLGKGVDGFRLDIFNVIFKDPEFRNNPCTLNPIPSEKRINFQILKYNINQPENLTFAKELRHLTGGFPGEDKLLLGEIAGDFQAVKGYLGENHDGLHLAFLFDMMIFKFRAGFFREKVKIYERVYPYPFLPVYVFSNHDQHRSMTRLGNDLRKARLLAMMQLTLRGVPVVYYGEEIGMTDNQHIERKNAQDPLAHIYPWIPAFVYHRLPVLLNRDECRTPMQWDSSTNAGFCKAGSTPWLPVNPDYKLRNVKAQMADPESLWHTFRTLLHIRKAHPALHAGTLEVLEESLPENVFGYTRMHGDDVFYVLLNFSPQWQKVTVMDGEIVFGVNGAISKSQLPPYAGVIIRSEKS